MVRISSARVDLENARIDNPIIKAYGETMVGGAAGTNTTSAYTVDISAGNAFNLVLNASCVFTFSNATATGNGCPFTIFLKQDPTGGWTVTWPAAVKWPGNRTPLLTSGAGHINIFSFVTYDGGTTYFGSSPGTDHKGATNTLYGWGFNSSGQIGDNTPTSRSLPVQIGVFTTWSSVSARGYHTAALKSDGTMWTWGKNNNGQLGDNTALATRSSPTQVGTLTTWSSAAGGVYFTAAVDTSGKLWAWGYNNSGQLGDNTAGNKSWSRLSEQNLRIDKWSVCHG